MNGKDLRRFVHDAREIALSIPDALSHEDLDEIFRHVHSIKSIAAQVGESAIAGATHELESALASARSRGSIEAETRRSVAAWLNYLDSSLISLEHKFEEQAAVDELDLTDFERQLLSESIRRGERFYRLSCNIDKESPVKLARAHLVINNLEIEANVIKSIPPLSIEDETMLETLSIYLTTDVDERRLYEAANVDEIHNIRLDQLSGRRDTSASASLLNEATDAGHANLHGAYRIEARTLEWALSQLNEADAVLRRNSTTPASHRFTSILGSLRDSLLSVQRQRVGVVFERLEQTARDIAASLEKRVDFDIRGFEILLDSRLLDAVADPLLHLVRNAIDHGIESPEERRDAGKPEVATITLSFDIDGATLEFRIADDGRGIDRRRVEADARKRGIEIEADGDILSLLATPGYSTLENPTGISGRGFGFDIVVQRITGIGGTVSIESTPGSGTMISLRLPPIADSGAKLIIRNGDRYFAIPSSSIERIIPVDAASFKRDRSGGIYSERIPLHTIGGRISVRDALPKNGTMLLVRYLHRTGWLCVDDVLFERSTSESDDAEPIELIDPSIIA